MAEIRFTQVQAETVAEYTADALLHITQVQAETVTEYNATGAIRFTQVQAETVTEWQIYMSGVTRCAGWATPDAQAQAFGVVWCVGWGVRSTFAPGFGVARCVGNAGVPQIRLYRMIGLTRPVGWATADISAVATGRVQCAGWMEGQIAANAEAYGVTRARGAVNATLTYASAFGAVHNAGWAVTPLQATGTGCFGATLILGTAALNSSGGGGPRNFTR